MRVYNIVQSVKGGCGKTTFSIMLAGFLGKKENRDECGKTCLVDADFQGTSLIHLFIHDENLDKTAPRKCYLNEKMRRYNSYHNYVREYNGYDRIFYYVPSSPEYVQKAWFLANAQMGYIPAYGI